MANETAIKKPESEITRTERTRDRMVYTPQVDIVERDDELLLIADLPGVRGEDIDVQYEQGLLTLQARVEPRQDEPATNYLLREYGVGDFYRSFRVGEGIDHDKIRAEMRNGVLELHLPKSEAAKPKKIPVHSQ